MRGDFDEDEDPGGMCPRCKCCELEPEECDQCGGDGVYGHDCGEDTCCCLDPEENEDCDACGGRGFFRVCLGGCDEHGKHKEYPVHGR